MHFVDTNVLVYGFDDSDPIRRDRAQGLMRHLWVARTGRIGHQVLQEFYVTVTRKLNPTVPSNQARTEVEALQAWRPVPPSAGLIKAAWDIEDRHGLSWWDSLIVAAALASDCRTLLTEDLQHGLTIGSLRVVNPFLPDFDPAALA